MEKYMEYWWNLWQTSWNFAPPPFLYRLWPSLFRGYKVSFGVWMRLSRDSVLDGSGPTDMKKHVYEKLRENCIRILAIEPGSFGDPLQGTLVDCNLQRLDVEYEALSYVWGRYYPGCYVNIDNTRLEIFGSLDDALRHLRLKNDIRYIWADSICINQSDIEEKTQQVMLMIDIYRKAQSVNIWLGLSNEHSTIGMETLSFLASDADFNAAPPWKQYPPLLLSAGLRDIMLRPYFQRIWVVQEVTVATHLRVIVGRQSFAWDAKTTSRFLARLKLAEISPAWEQAGLTAVDLSPLVEMVELANMKALGMQPVVKSLDVIHNMRRRKATDRRDMVFALINLATDGQDFEIDYSLSVEEVFRRLYKHLENISGVS